MGLRRFELSALLAITLAAGALHAAPLAAAVVGVSAAPARVSVPAIGSASVTVNWTVQRLVTLPPQEGTLSSPRLRILIDGTQVANLPRPLAQSVVSEANTSSFRIREVIALPQPLIYRAVKEGKTLELVRAFNDSLDDISEEASMEVVPSGPGSTALAVQRLELAFDDGTRSRVISRGEPLRVTAEINSNGTGLISGVWEVALGAALGETPAFVPLTQVRQGVAGGGRSLITSPRLPTGADGTALVRFRITEPRVAFQTPQLQYYVTPARPDPAPLAEDILLTAPVTGGQLEAGTRFAWSALPAAEAYQLAFYAVPAGPAEPLDTAEVGQPATPEALRQRRAAGDAAIAGVFLPGGSNETRLEDSLLSQLPSKRSYLWQVIAFDGNGAVIGSSSLREIFKP